MDVKTFMWGACWRSTKQPFPALRTAEAALIAILDFVVMGGSVGCTSRRSWGGRAGGGVLAQEMAAAVVRSFEVDMEKVCVLAKMIAAFQSVQGVSAMLAEERGSKATSAL